MSFNPGHPGATTIELTLYHRRDGKNNLDNTKYGTYTLHGCLIDHLNWSSAKGFWDESEEDSIALNIPCLYHHPIDGLTHGAIIKGCELTIPTGRPMAGTWVVDSLPACSADAEIGDILRVRRK